MKRVFQFLIFFVATAALGQGPANHQEEQIKDLIRNSFQKIFSDLDPEGLDTYLTEDFLLLENGEVWDMEMMRDYLKRSAARKSEVERINSFDFIEIEIEGDMAWVAYYNKAEFKRGEEVVREINWVESASAILTEEGWKLQLLHSTVAKE